MKLIFLGSGSAFTIGADNYQSNMLLINERGQKLLIDCGSDIRFSMHAAGYSHLDITDIYISHLNADRVGGLEFVGFKTKFDPNCDRPNLYISKDLAEPLWDNTLSGGMRSIGGDVTDLETFFSVKNIGRERTFVWEGIEFYLAKTVYLNNGYSTIPSYGLFFKLAETKILLTTDTRIAFETLGEFYDRADIIFHDCETSRFPSSVHAHYNDLVKLPEKLRKKMWLYGYQPGKLPNAKKDGFCGFIKRGQVFETSDLLVHSTVQLAV